MPNKWKVTQIIVDDFEELQKEDEEVEPMTEEEIKAEMHLTLTAGLSVESFTVERINDAK